jgi:hypothetical protein
MGTSPTSGRSIDFHAVLLAMAGHDLRENLYFTVFVTKDNQKLEQVFAHRDRLGHCARQSD